MPEAPSITIANSQATITAEDDAAIYYTTDGSDPTVESKRYADPISVEQGDTVKAVAIDIRIDSEVAAENR